MPFFPDSPFTIAYAVILAAAVLFCLASGPRSIRLIAAVMVLNWIGTRAVTAWGGDLTAILASVVDAGSAVLLVIFVRTTIANSVAALFGLMLLTYAAFDLGAIGLEQMWAAADLFAYLQILLMLGGGVGTFVRRRRLDSAHNPDGFGSVHSLVAVRSDASGFAETDNKSVRQNMAGPGEDR